MARQRNELILADLVRARAERDPELDVLTFEHLSLDDGATSDEVRTYADLAVNANRLAAALRARGVSRGDRVAVMLRNHPEFVETMIACSILGAVIVPIDPRTRGGVVCGDYCADTLVDVRAEAPDLRFAWGVASAGAGGFAAAHGIEPLAAVLEGPAETLDVCIDDPGAPLQIMFTSGTTGDPKGIVGDNARVCAAGILGHIFGYRQDERPYTGLSLSHGNAQSVTLMPALSMGLRAVFSRRFTKSRLWDVCRAYGCTTYSLVGGMATAIYSQPARPDDADNPVRMVVSGGMPAAIWPAFEKRFGVRILEFYGAMDGGGMAFKPIGQGPIGSFGKPMPNIEMKILDERDREVPPGVVGEICVRPAEGGEASVEYVGDPEASKRKIRRGWNRSGDMGHRDEDGWLFFDHRAGGGIRHNGDFVHPGFVEKAVAECPEVTDVFVYGVPAASGAPGEKDVVAAVALAPGADPAAVFAACRRRLEPNFVPSYLQVVDEIPKTASEKPQERILQARFDPAGPGVYTEKRS
jgi:crotonobetaine/carnitine-CoA ligase